MQARVGAQPFENEIGHDTMALTKAFVLDRTIERTTWYGIGMASFGYPRQAFRLKMP